ncbi:MAG TPA: serine/threonine-protein kinase [Thermoguttaceae bacterium]|nr:serine/threonine-protein kinase [Thermoguttaceae bacterium]
MSTTMFHERSATRTWGGHPAGQCPPGLLDAYSRIVDDKRLSWTEHHSLIRRLGAGGQGVVYLSERRSGDNFTLPVALKVFSPEPYDSEHAYDQAMGRIAHVAARVAQIQQDNLLDVHNWVDRHRIRLMEMEWIDGFDLNQLMDNRMLEHLRHRVSNKRWEQINQVIVTAGPVHPRLKPGIAIAIIRDCLAALASLHRERIVHGDLKPSNIMIKRTGNAKIIDIGSAFDLENLPPIRTCTPAYAAPEVLERSESSPRSDLASLGYVLIQMLSGTPPFAGYTNFQELLEAKLLLAQRLPKILPEDVACNELLMTFCQKLIAPDPARRFPSAEEADLLDKGAASFHRQLIQGNLASEYENDIRVWLAELEDYPATAEVS